MTAVEEISDRISEQYNKAIDVELKKFLDKHKLPADREKLKNLGYEIIINYAPWVLNKRSIEIKLCKIEDKLKFDFIYNLSIE